MARFVHSNFKNLVLVNFKGILLSNGYTRKRPWEVQETVYQRGVKKSYQEFIFACNSVGCYLGHLLEEGADLIFIISYFLLLASSSGVYLRLFFLFLYVVVRLFL